MKTKGHLILILIASILQTGCLYVVRYDGPYHGKVVDEQTREPIEGVVILGWWNVHHFGLGGGYGTYHDARESVTDQKGEFTIPGQGLRIFSSLEPMQFLVFKSGYTYFQSAWDSLKIETRKDMIKWEGETPIFPLRKLTDDKRKRYDVPSGGPNESLNKTRIMTQEINKERVYKGLKPLKVGGEND